MADLCMVRSGHTTLKHSISVGGKIIVVSAGVAGNLAPPKFGPLENIVYFIAVSLEIVKLLLKPNPKSVCHYL